jgi:hypothetical protein
MFIHFVSSEGVDCDNCGNPSTIMSMLVGRSERSVNLCNLCFRAMFQVLDHASKKLRTPPGLE